ncbi:hypothetical protein K431DRAFT_309702 [Polychaeton citri CBS 116435]|uniref:Uncharacterized protein n=1 Tax=Polychaeton citri CBS 116435 TaxID=1314669 RepID=A0A9P4UTU2_9PEZI|nr:hypothetical protein K431DRAFT_309702 [Polychaeton citri CBS 116435]
MFAQQKGRKRSRTVDADGGELPEKKARPTTGDSSDGWNPHDSVIGTPQQSGYYQQPKYDSDSASSMISEPGSPQDFSEDSDMDVVMDTDEPTANQDSTSPRRSAFSSSSSPWKAQPRIRQERKPTPFSPLARAGVQSPSRLKMGNHVRDRHPQQNFTSDRLEVPSPIDEDEVPTPPSAAEAAGSQFSMLSVSDVNMDDDGMPADRSIPTINIDPTHSMTPVGIGDEHAILPDDSDAEGMDASDSNTLPEMVVRKQRQRSGALSSPRATPDPGPSNKRTFLMGFRADCEKCRMRVPGHMNHLLT